MGYYDERKNVEHYIQMAEGYDGKLLIQVLHNHLQDGATVLELGMGPGKDLLLLSENYQVTGSDGSAVFVKRFQNLHPEIEVMQLDAVTIKTEQTYDCIYSNKVLYHLTRDDLRASFKRQAQVLNANGIALHSFWYGNSEDEQHGLRFVYYTEETLKTLIGDEYKIIDIQRYAEMEADDSLYIVLCKQM